MVPSRKLTQGIPYMLQVFFNLTWNMLSLLHLLIKTTDYQLWNLIHLQHNQLSKFSHFVLKIFFINFIIDIFHRYLTRKTDVFPLLICFPLWKLFQQLVSEYFEEPQMFSTIQQCLSALVLHNQVNNQQRR